MKYIYESPDGGHTVFRREFGSDIKEIVSVDEEYLEHNNQWFAWRDILRASKNNSVLKEALDRAQIIYELSKHND